MKSAEGFRAELSGLELATLVQLLCSRRERMVARISSYGEEGVLYSVAGRIVHATLGELVGEEAVLRMLSWHSGDLALCDLPFPPRATVQRSTEGLLLLAAKYADESALDAVLAAPSASKVPSEAQRNSALPPPPVSFSTPPPPPRTTLLPPPTRERASTPPPPEPARAHSRPPPLPAHVRKPLTSGESSDDPALVASVRVSAEGALRSSSGSGDQLAQLVAYVTRLLHLIQADFALDPFEALHVELSAQRLLLYQDAGDTVGLLMLPGSAVQELRSRLGV